MFTGLAEYVKNFVLTHEYRNGIIVEISGMIINILLLSFLVPVIISAINKIKQRPTVYFHHFYSLQICHRLLDVFFPFSELDTFEKQYEVLSEEMKKDRSFRVYRHSVYGNLENKIFLMKKIEKERLFKKELITEEALLNTVNQLREILAETDHLIMMFNSMPKLAEKLFGFRGILYVGRDLFQKNLDNLRKGLHAHTMDIERFAEQCTFLVANVFKIYRKPIDRRFARRDLIIKAGKIMFILAHLPQLVRGLFRMARNKRQEKALKDKKVEDRDSPSESESSSDKSMLN